ncbi:MAG: helix-turn-helix transcriptional regulator [Pseudomonadota bacterium]
MSLKFGSDLQVDDLSRAAGLSTSHFSRVFKHVIGETPYNFLVRYRVERAADMLTDQSRPIKDIALACGFSDQPHLTRAFRRFRAATPKQWWDMNAPA